MTHKSDFLKRYGLPANTSLSLEDMSALTGVPIAALHIVYNRGIGAWKTNIESVRLKKDFSKNPDTKKYPRSSRLPKERWAAARVYSFLMGGKTFQTADNDVARHYGLV